jgi:hypothetical protein
MKPSWHKWILGAAVATTVCRLRSARLPSRSLEGGLAEVRRRQISALRKLIEENPHHPKKADLRFRLAEKLWAEAEYTRCVDQGDCIP